MTTYPNSTVIPWTEFRGEISERCAAPPRLLVACDFDGTLTSRISDPGRAVLTVRALETLRRVQEAPGVRLAVISGRALRDIERRVPLSDVILAGNHGMELRGPGLNGECGIASALRPRVGLLAARLDDSIGGVPGIRIENKGLTLTVHLRNVIASHVSMVEREVRWTAELETAFRLQEGHDILEFVPDTGRDKGTAVRQIAASLDLPLSAVFYAGDDVTDESVFAAVREGIMVRVGGQAGTAACWSARNPDEVLELLDWIAAARCGGCWRGDGPVPEPC